MTFPSPDDLDGSTAVRFVHVPEGRWRSQAGFNPREARPDNCRMALIEPNKSMNDHQRFALHFGPYHAPPFDYGDAVMDEVRSEVTVVKLSDAKILWPIGKLRQGRSLIVYGGLAAAIRQESNQAVCHWWGITPQTVTEWRKALNVEPVNAGSRELFVQYGREERSLDALPNARVAASLPEARRKLAEARRGKPQPNSVIEALRRANLGRKATEETRRKQSEAQRARATSSPRPRRGWAEYEDSLCRTLAPGAVATLTGRSLHAVYLRCHRLGLPDRRAEAHRERGPIRTVQRWNEAEDDLVRTLSPQEAAQQTCRSLDAVRQRRGRLGLSVDRQV